MVGWHDPFTVLLLMCPLLALLTGFIAGVVSRNWGFGVLTGAIIIIIPILSFQVTLDLLIWTPIYALIGLIGSIIGWGFITFTQTKTYD